MIGSGLEQLGPAPGAPRQVRRSEITGVLSGTGPTYAFVQSIETAPGTWSAGPITGFAYEVNGIVGLAGKRARLVPDPFGRYRFQHLAQGEGEPFDPECSCWTEGTAPSTLSWTYVSRIYDFISESFITLGTTSGTLTYTSAVTFGTTPCEVEGIDKDSPAPANPSGWIGEFEFYTYGIPEPGDDFPPVLTPHCSNIAPAGGVYDHEICRWLALMCQRGLTTETGGDPVANPLLFLNAIATDPETCGIVSLTGPDGATAGVADVSCSPFLYEVEFSDGSLLTITT